MCGITGILFYDHHRTVDHSDLRNMCTTMVHRGPDDEGIFVDRYVGLAMRRLKVIDLVTGHQPLSNEDGSVWIVFNGEIYNYQELRSQLEQKGHKFVTNTDTETIVHAYEEFGEQCVTKLNGMFAFAIWDRKENKLVLARDRLGVKPLYYYFDDRCFVFGSELKAILAYPEIPKAIDLEALDTFLTFEYIPAPLSILKDIKKLPPGNFLIAKEGNVFISQYWDLQFLETTETDDEARDHLYALLKDSVRMRLISDVPLGAFLSGGVDSSAIVSMMSEVSSQPVKTFSIGFDDPSYNELRYARMVAKHFGTDHHELIIRPDAISLVELLIQYLDEPFADVSVFPTYLVSQLARQHVTVVLSGDGGDELFAGYEWYLADKIERYYRWLPAALRAQWIPHMLSWTPPSERKKGLVNKIKRFVEGSLASSSLQHFRWSTFMTEETKSGVYAEDLKRSLAHHHVHASFLAWLNRFPEADPLWQQQYADIKTYLADDILTKVDRMSMANSLEARTPFLDYRLVEFAASLPSRLKLNGFQMKHLLKKCMRDKLPKPILTRKKEGFSIPLKNWLRGELRPFMDDLLSPQRIKKAGFFNPSYIDLLRRRHIDGSANNSHQLWSLMTFEIWRNHYLN